MKVPHPLLAAMERIAAREPRHGGRGALNDPAEGVRVLETLRDEPSLGTWAAVLVLLHFRMKCARRMRCAGASDSSENSHTWFWKKLASSLRLASMKL